MPRFEVGSLVRCREREWVVLPSEHPDLLLLRPLGGVEAEVCGIYLPVEGNSVAPATFPPPDPATAGDFVSGRLLRDAARLSLRSGAGPFRSLGRIHVRPRSYQLVPLLMALRLATVRLLIADDVGIGKTIEAGLIARELYDRGEIRRLTVLCPPHLCDQWQRELAEKFALEAVVVRSSTAAALERGLPRGDLSIWEHYPLTVASIDYVKSERRRDNFLRAAPELVIVDEAHTATDAAGRGAGQQQRYDLVRSVAARPDRHLLLLTATPHSGIEDAFKSLLGLLDPRFATLSPERLSDHERDELARHFVQRRRADVRHWLNEDTPFPARETTEVTYSLARSPGYRRLFDDVFAFTRELVREGEENHKGTEDTKSLDSSDLRDLRASVVNPPRHLRSVVQRRARYWAALALLRCVMSSPAAAEKALRVRAIDSTTEAQRHREGDDEEVLLALEATLSEAVREDTESERVPDFEPDLSGMDDDLSVPLHLGGEKGREHARLIRFAARAAQLHGNDDPKLQALLPLLEELLRDGFNPIVYCRYIATANYLAQQLAGRLKVNGDEVRVLAVTGERSEEEREALIAELSHSPRRLLVATDCLSEGINLQHAFDAVVHYDLPWNPNRLEQREGRVDRYGQRAPKVRTALLYGKDNPMDEAVMKVLLRKAVSIHRSLGISVPLPVDSDTVVNALIASLFETGTRQLTLFDAQQEAELASAEAQLAAIERRWDDAVARAKESRTRFAQRRIKPEEVARELEESDAVLGDPAAVEAFVRAACERLGAPLARLKGAIKARSESADLRELRVFVVNLSSLPLPVRERVAHLADKRGDLTLTFETTAPAGVERVGRNHPFVVALADYALESALTPDADRPLAARSGLIVTDAVARATALLLLRIRALIESPRQTAPALAEELVVTGFTREGGVYHWLDEPAALALLERAEPRENVSAEERSQGIAEALGQLAGLADELAAIAESRAARLREAHQRVRAQTGGGRVSVRPSGPPDVLGVYVLWPQD